VQQQLRHYSVTQKRGRRTGQMPWVKDEGVQSIRDRPQAINTRDTIGHLEADSIVGKRNEPDKILVIIDRASRFVRLGLVRHGTAAEVASLFAKWQDNNVGIPMLSVTTDQGYEFSALPKQLSGRLYACDPGKPYQKGQVEHVNKLIRQYIPKGVSLRDVTQAKLDWVALQLNSRVRKRLGWKSPLTVLSEMTDRTVKSKANLPKCLKTPV
jgi:IS30 family transposase